MYKFRQLVQNGILLSLPDDKVTTLNCYAWSLRIRAESGADLDPGFTARGFGIKKEFLCLTPEEILENVRTDLYNLGFHFSFQTSSSKKEMIDEDILKVFFTPPIEGKRPQGSYHFMRFIQGVGWAHKPGLFLQPQVVKSFYGYNIQIENAEPMKIYVQGQDIVRIYDSIGYFLLHS